jgi:plastocyanin domain-containing protein
MKQNYFLFGLSSLLLIVISAIVYYSLQLKKFSSMQGVSDQDIRNFDFVLQNKAYQPDTVKLKLGETVVFNIDNRDNESHGLHLPQFGVAQAIPALQKASVQFVANQTGSVATSCASGHPEKINVIVES